MAKGKSKWEKEYEEYSSKDIDKEIKKLEKKLEKPTIKGAKATSSKEYRKMKVEQSKEREKEVKEIKQKIEKLKTIKEALPQVEKVLKHRAKLEKKLKELENAKLEIKQTQELGAKSQKLEKELKEIDAELSKLKDNENKLNEALKNPSLSEEKRTEYKNLLSKNMLLQKSNHEKYSKNRAEFEDTQNKLASQLGKEQSIEKLDREIQLTKNMISKSNFICKNLMQGKKMDEITVDFAKWENRTYTDETNRAKTVKDSSKTTVESKGSVNKAEATNSNRTTQPSEKPKGFDEIDRAVQKRIQEEMVPVSEFDQKHPALAKIKNFFKAAYHKVVPKRENKPQEQEPVVAETVTHQDTGKLSKEQIEARKAAYYKRMAEKGTFMKPYEVDVEAARRHAQVKTQKQENGDQER